MDGRKLGGMGRLHIEAAEFHRVVATRECSGAALPIGQTQKSNSGVTVLDFPRGVEWLILGG